MDKFIAHILVVDDDDGIRSLVKKYLNENNFLVTTADNAENASEKIKIIIFVNISIICIIYVCGFKELLLFLSISISVSISVFRLNGNGNGNAYGLANNGKHGADSTTEHVSTKTKASQETMDQLTVPDEEKNLKPKENNGNNEDKTNRGQEKKALVQMKVKRS